jgi:dipeptidyl aminopeptidase/acylaminoacyl peptidase
MRSIMQRHKPLASFLTSLAALLLMGCGSGTALPGSTDTSCKDRSTAADTDLPVPSPALLGGRVAFLSDRDDSDGEIYLYDPQGAALTRLTNNHLKEEDLAPSPDGTALAFMVGRDLYRLDLDCITAANGCTQENQQLLASRVSLPDWTRWGLAVTLNFTQINDFYPSDIAVVDPSSGEVKAFGLGDSKPGCGDCGMMKASQPTLNPQASCLLYVQQAWPSQDSHMQLQEFSFFLGVPMSGSCPALHIDPAAQDPAWLPDGQRLAWSESGICAATADAKKTLPTVLWTPGQNASHPSFSPDGKWMVFESDLSGNAEIYVMGVPASSQVNRAGKSQLNLSSDPKKDWGPVWLP